MAGKSITTLRGLDEGLLERLVAAFEAAGASQCGFCTPGILARLVGLARRGTPNEAQVRTALGAHLCRCTGLQPIVEAALAALNPTVVLGPPRDPNAAEARATLESGVRQQAGPSVVRGEVPFSADLEREGSIALATADGGYVVADSVSAARQAANKVQGRNSTAPLRLPLEIPELDDVVLRLATSFLEPAYVEPDASWCSPGGEATTPFANAGAFGAKRHSAIVSDARRLADKQGHPVLALWPREEVVRRGKKRPPLSLALRADGSGRLRVGQTAQSDDVAAYLATQDDLLQGLDVEVVDIPGPPVGTTHRGAVIAEVLAARAILSRDTDDALEVTTPNGARARVHIDDRGSVAISVAAGDPLCAITLRSYVIGAVHHALGQVRSEGIAVDADGIPHDLTIRSFGILTASNTPHIDVTIEDDKREAVAVGLAAFAASLAAAWLHEGLVPHWPTQGEFL